MTSDRHLSFLHLGYPKCASTFLQKEVFVPERGIVNIFDDPAWERFLNLSLLRLQTQDYVDLAGTAPALPEVPSGTILGLSNENLLGQALDCGTVMARLRALFGDVPVLIIVRKQEDILFSTYVNSLRSGFFGRYDDFMRQALWDWRTSVAGRVRYGRMYREACRHFSDVRVMAFEQLRHDPSAFFDGLEHLLDKEVPRDSRKVNVTEGAAGVMGWRLCNRLFRHGYGLPRMTVLPDYVVGRGLHEDIGLPNRRRPYRRRRRIGRVVRYLDRFFPAPAGRDRAATEAAYAEQLDALYAEDNRELSRALGLDLARYGYRGLGEGRE